MFLRLIWCQGLLAAVLSLPSRAHCSSDEPETMTTPISSRPVTTRRTTHAPTLNPPLKPFIVRRPDSGIVCVVMLANFTITIPYVSRSYEKKEKAFVINHLKPSVSGNCGDYTDDLEITFNRNYKLLVTIARRVDPGEATADTGTDTSYASYFWKVISFQFIRDSYNFPDVIHTSDDPIKVTTTFDDVTKFVCTSPGSYKCSMKEDVNLGTGITLQMTTLQYRAFGETPDEDFPDINVSGCPRRPADDTSDNEAIVGGVLLIVAVVVFIAGICYRGCRALDFINVGVS